MLSFELMAITIKTFARVFFISPLWVLEHANTLSGISADQVQSLALVLLRVTLAQRPRSRSSDSRAYRWDISSTAPATSRDGSESSA